MAGIGKGLSCWVGNNQNAIDGLSECNLQEISSKFRFGYNIKKNEEQENKCDVQGQRQELVQMSSTFQKRNVFN